MQPTFLPVRRYKKNTSGRDFVVGDLHGCFEQLRRELDARHYDPARDRLFSVGDLVDRGSESSSVLEMVRRYDIQSVRGNHEDVIVRWHLHGGKDASVRCNGGEWALELADDETRLDDIVAYMAALPYAIEIETDDGLVGIVHANVPLPSWGETMQALEQENRDGRIRRKVMWDRSRWKTRRTGSAFSLRRTAAHLLRRLTSGLREPTRHVEGVAAVIVGHTPTTKMLIRGNVINVDTGLVYGGNLTLLRLDEIPMLLNRKAAAKPAPAYFTDKGTEAHNLGGSSSLQSS
ncbi:metallophosphoesterase [Paraburkholderia sp. BCC1884]|uniref:metallophosphoesterase n=1 Tax=Paraburkholderia sp. BCC1884 TaxID=2562668 RepID=UPI00164287EE|nr:metallophosphoesterase [Paraburkholderia sp. BCC1884]